MITTKAIPMSTVEGPLVRLIVTVAGMGLYTVQASGEFL